MAIYSLKDKRLIFLNFNLTFGLYKNSEFKQKLFIDEAQVRLNFRRVRDADIVISVMHYPFSWLHNINRNQVERLIKENSHFILHDHHFEVSELKDSLYQCITIPTVSSYATKIDHYFYNFVYYDLDKQEGSIFFRTWNDKVSRWRQATDITDSGHEHFQLDSKFSDKKTVLIYGLFEDSKYIETAAISFEKQSQFNVILSMDEEKAKNSSSSEIHNDFKKCLFDCKILILIHKKSSPQCTLNYIRDAIKYSRTENSIELIVVIAIDADEKLEIDISHELVQTFRCNDSNFQDCLKKIDKTLET